MMNDDFLTMCKKAVMTTLRYVPFFNSCLDKLPKTKNCFSWSADQELNQRLLYGSEIIFNRDVRCRRVCPQKYRFDFVDV